MEAKSVQHDRLHGLMFPKTRQDYFKRRTSGETIRRRKRRDARVNNMKRAGKEGKDAYQDLIPCVSLIRDVHKVPNLGWREELVMSAESVWAKFSEFMVQNKFKAIDAVIKIQWREQTERCRQSPRAHRSPRTCSR
jgi:hypothetical protein